MKTIKQIFVSGMSIALASLILRLVADPIANSFGFEGSSMPYIFSVFLLQMFIWIVVMESEASHPDQTVLRKTVFGISFLILILAVSILTTGYGTELISIKWRSIIGTVVVGIFVFHHYYYIKKVCRGG